MRNQVWTISTLAKYLKNSLDNDVHIQSILVKGEISNFTRHRSGHLYFSLKDQGSRMNCVMFSSQVNKLKISPKEGLKVIARVKVSMYEPHGNLQLYVSDMQSDGIGDLYLAFEELKYKLHAQGLFDVNHKKQLPMYPKNIAVLSANTGAAIQDVLSIIARRWPIANVVVYPTLVQGNNASVNIIQNLKIADQNNHDIILLVRGGGSLEDLWCFNDETLAYTIYEMNTCIVSGVGHETDTTLVDYVSDLRAPTPSAAAELITPDIAQLKDTLQQYKVFMIQQIKQLMKVNQQQLSYYQNKPYFTDSEYYIQQQKMRLMMAIQGMSKIETVLNETQYQYLTLKDRMFHVSDKLLLTNRNELILFKNKLIDLMSMRLLNSKKEFTKTISLMDAYSPLKVLERGYAIALYNEKAIRSINNVNVDDEIEVQVHDGILKTTIKEIKQNGK